MNVAAVTGDCEAETSGVADAAALLAFTDSAVKRDAVKLAAARNALCNALGPRALVDTAAIVGSFQRMTRIADASGIPLDSLVNALSAELQDDLRLREFRSAASSAAPGAVVAFLAKLVRPLVFRVVGMMAKRARPRPRDAGT